VWEGQLLQNCTGTFFEGAITVGFVTSEVEAAVQASIVAAGYGK
jgi:hypothetical protein